MPRVALTPIVTSSAGVVATEVAGIADGHSFSNDGRTIVIVRNAHGSINRTITFLTSKIVDAKAVADQAEVIAFGLTGIQSFGPFEADIYNQADGSVHINYEGAAEADLNIRLIRVPRT